MPGWIAGMLTKPVTLYCEEEILVSVLFLLEAV